MSLIKQWIIDQERKMDEDLMFCDADRQYYIEQAMREEMDEPTADPIYQSFISSHTSNETTISTDDKSEVVF